MNADQLAALKARGGACKEYAVMSAYRAEQYPAAADTKDEADACIAELLDHIDDLSDGYAAANEAALTITNEWRVRAEKAEAEVEQLKSKGDHLEENWKESFDQVVLEAQRAKRAAVRDFAAWVREAVLTERDRLIYEERWTAADTRCPTFAVEALDAITPKHTCCGREGMEPLPNTESSEWLCDCACHFDALFPPSPLERLADLERFVAGELGHRLAMVDRHGDKRDYWQGRVDEARRAAEHVSALRDTLEGVT